MKPRLAASTFALFLLLSMLAGCSGDPEKGKVKYLQSGLGHMQKGKYQEAAIQFRNALKLDPRFVDAYYQLAQVSLALHQWNDAYAALEHAIAIDPGRVDARLDRGRLYLAARNYAHASDALLVSDYGYGAATPAIVSRQHGLVRRSGEMLNRAGCRQRAARGCAKGSQRGQCRTFRRAVLGLRDGNRARQFFGLPDVVPGRTSLAQISSRRRQ